MTNQTKVCDACDEEKHLSRFVLHPTRLYSSQCVDCFPLAARSTREKALAVALVARYPGRAYDKKFGIPDGYEHWQIVQSGVVKTLRALGSYS